MTRKSKKNITQEHKINGKLVLESLKSIASFREISIEDVINSLKESILISVRKDYPKDVPIVVSLDEHSGDIGIYRIFKIVDKITDYELEITLNSDEIIKRKDSDKSYISGETKEFYEEIPFKFERKIFETLKGVNKTSLNAKEKLSKFDNISHITDKPIVGIVTNIRKKNIFINYNDIEFILPFEKSDKVKYNISDKIMFVYDYMESNSMLTKIYATQESHKLIPSLFKQYNYYSKHGMINITSGWIFNGNMTVLVTNYNGSIKQLNSQINDSSSKEIKHLCGIPNDKKINFMLINSIEDLFTNILHNVDIEKIELDIDNYTIVVSNDDYEKAVKNLNRLKSCIKACFDEYENYSFKIESAKMYKEKMIESKETTIKHLMELEISKEVAEILYEDLWESIEIIAYSKFDEFDEIGDELNQLGVTVNEIQNKAKNYLLNLKMKEEFGGFITLENLGFNPDEVNKLKQNHIYTSEDVSNLDIFELKDILNIDNNISDDLLKNIIMKSRVVD